MHTESLKLVSITTEAVLVERLLSTVKKLGATGYTLTEARGEGSLGRRTGEVPGDNKKIEILASAQVAERILDVLAADYFPHYAVVAWVSEVGVVRGSKFVRP